MRWQALVFWPQAHLRQIGGVVIGGVALLMVDFLLTPSVDPIYPAELSSSPGTSGSAAVPQVEHDDFVTRPLFLAVRRPTASVVVADAVLEPAPQVQEMPFDGVGLLGVFASGGVLQLNNFCKLRGFGWKGFKKMNLWKQDKGQNACAAAFLRGIQAGNAAIPADEIFEVARVSVEVAELLRSQ